MLRISSTVSPPLPPEATIGLIEAKLCLIKFSKEGLKGLFLNTAVVWSIIVIELAGMFDSIPPPTIYLTVKLLVGTSPYSWVWNTDALLKLLYKY